VTFSSTVTMPTMADIVRVYMFGLNPEHNFQTLFAFENQNEYVKIFVVL